MSNAESKVETKQAKVKFFKVTARDLKKVNKFVCSVKKIHNLFETRQYDQIPTIEIDEDQYYIHAMQKWDMEERRGDNNLYYWLITVARVDLETEIEFANISKSIDERRRQPEHDDNEGLVLDTQIIFDPFRSIIAMYSRKGAISTYNLKRFICNLVDEKGIKLEVILNRDGYARINALSEINQLTYRIASPTKFSAFRDDDRSELADLKFAEKFKSEELSIVLKPTGSKQSIIQKVRALLYSNEYETKILKVDGINDGVREEVDLIKNKLIYSGTIKYTNLLDDSAIYGFLNRAYSEHYDYLNGMFEINYNWGDTNEEREIETE